MQMIEPAYMPFRLNGAAVRYEETGRAGLGDVFQDIAGVVNIGLNVVDTITGAKAQRESQNAALELERLRAQQAEQQAKSNTTMFLIVGGVVASVVVGAVLLKGK